MSLELGGNNSLIILDDADLDVAASNARWGAWLHQGQVCITTGRVLVDERIADAIVGAVLRTGGTYEGLFHRPTVLDHVRPGMRAFDEEIFGPVASVTRCATDDEAVALANQTPTRKSPRPRGRNYEPFAKAVEAAYVNLTTIR